MTSLATADPTVQRALPGQGPNTRVRLIGSGTEPTIRAALTRAWRLIGQPITVVLPPHLTNFITQVVDRWAVEHWTAGIRTEHPALTPPDARCVVIPADGPVPWCGCVHPPCPRCHEQHDRETR